jgi:alkylation response protein AidB-like acyl-CoA dehydrogenase
LLAPPSLAADTGAPLESERRTVESMKKAALMGLGLAMQAYREKLADQQEVLMHLADMLIETFAAESALLRAAAALSGKLPKATLHLAAAQIVVNDGAMRVEASARQALAILSDGDTLRMTLAALKRLFKQMPLNTAVLRRQLADDTVARGAYPF